jgi:hypothetical protein
MCHFFHLVVHSPHTLGLVGLVLNTAGAFLLIPFPPDLKGYRADGTLPGPAGFGWSRFIVDGRRIYLIQRIGFSIRGWCCWPAASSCGSSIGLRLRS